MTPIVYGSVCSGIEAATVAWHPLGWKPSFFSEIERFPRQVLTHHYPNTPLHGDFTTIQNNDYAPINLLVGGTPCQSFSVAGLRKGLDDPRGNLTLAFLGLAERLHPRWIVWENVPGVLSIDGGRALGAFLGGLAKLGYGFAYRILDAQFAGVPQRRRRIFVVGYFGDHRPAAAVLFERHSLRRHSPPSRKTRKESPSYAEAGIGDDCQWPADVAPTFDAPISFKSNMSYPAASENVNNTLEALNPHAVAYAAPVAATLDKGVPGRGAGGLNAGDEQLVAETRLIGKLDCEYNYGTDHEVIGSLLKTGHGKGLPMVALDGCDVAHSLCAHGRRLTPDTETFVGHKAVDIYNLAVGDVSQSLRAGASSIEHTGGVLSRNTTAIVRRLTPVECERLQGFPDGYTDIKVGGKPTPDGPRYKALGNSMAVPVMHWIGKRIQMVQELLDSLDANRM